MNRFDVIVFVLLATSTQFCRGSENPCQQLCCSMAANRTGLNLHFEKGNNINCTKECLQPRSSDTNVTLQQLCSKQQNNRTNKEAMTSSLPYLEIDCQEMFDKASNDFVGLVKRVKVLFRRIQDFWYINITWDKLNDPKISNKWTYYAVQWKPLDREGSRCSLVSKNQTFLVINSTEDGWEYPQTIHLNVSTYPLMKNIGYRYDVTGRPISAFKGVKVRTTKEPTKVSPEILAVIITVGSIAGFILFIVMVILVAWKRKMSGDGWCRYLDRWTRRTKQINRIRSLQSENQDHFEYDTSILYSSLDEKWVTEELIPLLETEHKFKCFIHFRDFEAGKVIHENMADAVYKCRKNITVVSKNFLESNYCKDELDMALERVQRCRDCSLIVVNLDGVSSEQLPKALRIRTFVNITNYQERKTWRNRLVKQISVEEDITCSKGDARNVQGSDFSSDGLQGISHINELSSSSTESV